ncbi:MAG TPA: hypothetical protein VKQ36_14190, partial [Ktedonobacterales bacterium]|nr:hypothetical protein [Ktedonobacterales bacterium]
MNSPDEQPDALRSRLSRIARFGLGATVDWLAAVPTGVILAGMGCAALDASTYIANSHLPLAPIVIAVGVLLTLLVAFALFVVATRTTHPLWLTRLTRPLLVPLLLWALWTSAQMAHVVCVNWPHTLSSA